MSENGFFFFFVFHGLSSKLFNAFLLKKIEILNLLSISGEIPWLSLHGADRILT